MTFRISLETFGDFNRPSEGGEDSPSDFEIRFEGTEPGLVGAFQEQLDAFKLIWVATASGQNEKGEVQASLQFRGERAKRRTFRVTEPHLRDGRFQLRFCELKYRQPRGVSVCDLPEDHGAEDSREEAGRYEVRGVTVGRTAPDLPT